MISGAIMERTRKRLSPFNWLRTRPAMINVFNVFILSCRPASIYGGEVEASFSLTIERIISSILSE